ncbi:uncharacterized protein LOC142549870 isoform X3 [Primulina tabacum]|uniref:uncharacterized protein LOC142549870 isoform X3 n=1 Tax=Primulina tabacum TaxID=48773 RepID=UPI003F5A651D
MGDSSCLMHGFSYASAVPNESKQVMGETKSGNPVHALGESVSFGRFMTESLSWERWSTFSHKKYVEEAERYAQPGSVAQKKAFFEAHYKRVAAQKAAALLEQENAAKNATVSEESEAGYIDDNADDEKRMVLNSNFEVEEKLEETKIQNYNKEHNVVVEEIGEEGRIFAKVETEAKWDSPMRRNSSNKFDNLENHDNLSASESTGTPEMERPLLIRGNSVQVENEATVERNSIQRLDNLESHETISGSESSGTPQMERPLLKQSSVASENNNPSVTSKKSSGLSKSSTQRKTWMSPSTPAKPITPHLKNENSSVTRSTRKSNVESMDRRRASPKSLRSIINLMPAKEPDKGLNSASKKAESSGIGLGSLRAPKDCATPSRTPLVGATKSRRSMYPKATPRSVSRRTKSSVDHSASGCKTSGPKWHLLSSVCTNSITACRKKLQSPTITTTPFVLRTEERAAKRKQKLEEKFNANKGVHKEKAEDEFRKLSRSFCFKARPLPDFYKERQTPKNQMKITPAAAKPQTSVLGKSIANKAQGNISMPTPAPTPPPPSLSKKAPKIRQILSTSSPERMSHENKSPNIQLL